MAPKTGSSLSDMMAADLAKDPKPKAAAKRAPKVGKVVKLSQPGEVSTAPAAAPEIEKVTIYLPKPAYRFIKQIALEHEKRPHDLLIQGIDMMLAEHGKSVKDFQK